MEILYADSAKTILKKVSGVSGHFTIPDSVKTIGERAFDGCTGLKSITIPDSVTIIEEAAFLTCTSLTTITVDEKNPKYDSREQCNAIIETATNRLLLGCVNTIIPDSVTNIGSNCFENCLNLKNPGL